jgi:hypothetical protein
MPCPVYIVEQTSASTNSGAVTADVVNFLDLSRFQMLMVAEQQVPLAAE